MKIHKQSRYKLRRYNRKTGKAWRRFFAGSISRLRLERDLWAAEIYINGGRWWLKHTSPARILKEKENTIRDINKILKQLTII